MMILKYPKNHQDHDFWDDVFDIDFVDDSFDVFVDGLQDALPSPYNVKLARYDLLTMSNWRVTVSLQFKLARYGLLTMSNYHVTVSLQCQTTVLRSPYNVKLPCYGLLTMSNYRVTVFLCKDILPFLPSAPPGSARA